MLCANKYQCYPLAKQCDEKADCLDNSDEWNCFCKLTHCRVQYDSSPADIENKTVNQSAVNVEAKGTVAIEFEKILTKRSQQPN